MAALFIILGLGAFSIFGLVLAATMLLGLRKAAVTGGSTAKPGTGTLRPLSERYGGLLWYCPPDATAVTAIDVAAMSADPQGKDIADVLAGGWQKAHEKRFGKVALTIEDVEAYVSFTGGGEPDRKANVPVHDLRGTVTAIRLKRPAELKVILRGLDAMDLQVEERLTRDGTQYFQIFRFVTASPDDPPKREDDLCFYLSDDRALLISNSRPEMEEALGRRPGRLEIRGPLREVVERADGVAVDALVGTNPPDTGRAGYFAGRAQAGSATTDRRATSVWFTLHGVEVQYREMLVMPDPDRAAAVRDKLIATYASRPAEPTGAVADYSRSAHVTSTGERVTVEATIGRAAFLDALRQVPSPPGGKVPPPKDKGRAGV